MELLQLEYFRTAAKYDHITKAAEALYITQPSLSNSLHRLEQELGVPLFDRIGRKVQLNQYGRIFLDGVNTAFDALDSSRSRMETLLREEQEKVRIIATTSLQVYPSLVQPLIELCPNMSFMSRDMTSGDIAHALKSHLADLCILGDFRDNHITDKALDSVVLESQPLCIVVRKDHPLAHKGSVRIAELKSEAFATGYQQRSQLEEVCQRAGFQPRVLFEGSHLHDVLQAVQSGHYAILSTWEGCKASGVSTDNLVALRIADQPLFLQRCLYWRKDDNSVAIGVLREAIIRFFAERAANATAGATSSI